MNDPFFFERDDLSRPEIDGDIGPLEEGDVEQTLDFGRIVTTEAVRVETDLDIVTDTIDEENYKLHGSDRHASHNADINKTIEENLKETDDTDLDSDAFESIKIAVVLHDFVAHRITEADKTAEKFMMCDTEKDQMKRDAYAILNNLRNRVSNKDLFDKAVIFAMDASSWEQIIGKSVTRGAGLKINDLFDAGKITDKEADIAILSLDSRTDELEEMGVSDSEVEAALKKCKLEKLDLQKIEKGAHKHNLAGLVLKAAEVLINLKNPPPNNPASTWRDSIEVINVYAPALQMFGFNKLAAELRGAALETQYDDTDGAAAKQFEKSSKYAKEIRKYTDSIIVKLFRSTNITTVSRVKSKGSSLRKRNSKRYRGKAVELPDGYGEARILEDIPVGNVIQKMANQFVDEIINEYEGTIELKHTLEGENPIDDAYENPRDSGYKAINLAFRFHPPDAPEEDVPFEVQFVTRIQHREHTYGRASHLFIEHDEKYDPLKHQPIFERLEARAENTKTVSPGSTVYSISEAVYLMPEYNFVYNQLFDAVKVEGQPICLVPKGLKERTKAVLSIQTEPIGPEDETIIMSPKSISEEQFIEALSILDVKLAKNENILDAIKLLKEKFLNEKRDDGEVDVINGHLLTTALMTAMYITQSGAQWEQDKPEEFIADAVTVALLHDYVEDLTPGWSKPTDKLTAEDIELELPKRMQIRSELIESIKFRFGDEIAKTVEALSAPIHILDQDTRREAYVKQSMEDSEVILAPIVKTLDRHGNHTADLIRWISGNLPEDENKSEEAIAKIKRYFGKTDRHFSKKFMDKDILPQNYISNHILVWLLAIDCGYNPSREAMRLISHSTRKKNNTLVVN